MNLLDNRQFDKTRTIAERLLVAGASECLLVGGFVHDQLTGVPYKDIDIEVYGLNGDEIVKVFSTSHVVDLVGRGFGVVKVDNEIDIRIPRRKPKTAAGHRGFP